MLDLKFALLAASIVGTGITASPIIGAESINGVAAMESPAEAHKQLKHLANSNSGDAGAFFGHYQKLLENNVLNKHGVNPQ